MSAISMIVSILSFAFYVGCFSNGIFVPLFHTFTIAALILPIIAKRRRILNGKSGRWMEIIAIVVGGFSFYSIIFAFTSAPIFIGYLGWVFCGIAYKLVK